MHADFTWRAAEPGDLPAILAIADQVHPDFPEDLAVFAERLALAPEGMRLLERQGLGCGYLVSHPWRSGTVPPLNALLHRLPEAADTFYIHDLALLPASRGSGAARAGVEEMAAQARARGFASMMLVAVNGSIPYWQRLGFTVEESPALAAKLATYEAAARLMRRPLA